MINPFHRDMLCWLLSGTVVVIALLGAASPSPVYAQAGLEEVIVTARKREETLQSTPIAVTAFSSDSLRQSQINNIGDLTQNVPGLSRREGRKTADLNIRGVGTRVPDISAEPGVGVYVDSIYIPRNDSQLVDVLNMESVQILRGPQGTLFGKNTAGGAILLTTKKPSDVVEGFASADIGDLGRLNLRGGVSGPLSENGLYGGLQVDSQQEDGYFEDAETGKRYGDTDRYSVLGQLRYQPDDAFTGDFLLFYGSVDENTAPATCVQSNPDAALQGFTAPGNATPYAELCNRSTQLNDDEELLFDRAPLRYEISNYLAGVTLAWDLETVSLKSITGYLYQEDIETLSGDVDASNLFTLNNQWEVRNQLNGNGIEADDETRTFVSQEIQLLGDAFDELLSYTVGAFYSYEKIDDSSDGQLLGPGGFLGTSLGDGMVSLLPASISFREAVIQEFENTSFAVFGQTILSLSDLWQLTLGVRYTREEKEAKQTNYVASEQFPVGNLLTREEFDALQGFIHEITLDPDNPSQGDDDQWSEFTPSATLTLFTPDAWRGDVLDGGILYASASSGFKAGGFSPFGENFLPFDPEKLWTYELGYKLDLLGQKARLNGAFYYSSYDDIQISVTRTFPNQDPDLPSVTENGITNAGKATIAGAELEFSVMPVEGLLLSATGSYIDAEYDSFIDEAPQPDGGSLPVDRSDEDFAYTPEQTYTAAVQYDWDTSGGFVTPRLSYYYVSSQFIGLDAAAAAAREAYLESYEVVNFRLAFQPAMADGLEVAGYVNNLFDEDYFGAGIASVGGVGSVALVPGRQRTYGIEFHFNW
ncbi:MAG: TonB-dependent receptor [Pseudomonadota bacterium]